MFSAAVPVYKVKDLGRTTQWYRDVLGFDGEDSTTVARLRRDRVEVFFREGFPRQSNNPWDTYVRLTGIDVFYDQIRHRACVWRGPENTSQGDREVEVRDENGFVLTFGEWNRQRCDRVAMYDIHPVLAVEDVAETVVWYRKVLGFKGDLRGNDFAMLRRDSVTLFFQQADVIRKDCGRPFEWDVYLRVASGQIAEVFQRVKDGAVVLRDLDVGDKGQAEFEIEDCNGYVLCFGEETGSDRTRQKNNTTPMHSPAHHTTSMDENALGMMEHFWHDGTQ